MTGELRFPHIYELLKAAGHDSAMASEILRDARCKDLHARVWIKTIAASRRSVLSAPFPQIGKYIALHSPDLALLTSGSRWLH